MLEPGLDSSRDAERVGFKREKSVEVGEVVECRATFRVEECEFLGSELGLGAFGVVVGRVGGW